MAAQSGDLAVSLKFAILIVATVLALPAAADDRCAVPLADWQPREALKAKLEQAGWRVTRIRADDGCYKVVAVDGAGNTVRGRFDPATLERVERGGHDGHDQHDGHHDEHD
jgi:hypothetical protein